MPSLPPLPLGGPDPRLQQLAAAWVYTHASENTRRAYWADLGTFAAFCAGRGASPLDAMSGDVEDFRAEVESSGASPATVARRLAALASFYRYAGSQDPEAANPVIDVARPALPATSQTDVLDEAEIAALLRAAAEQGPKTASLVCLLLLDGLKLGEAVGADAEDLVVRTRSVTLGVRRDGHVHEVGLEPRTAKALGTYLGGRTTGPLLLAQGAGEGTEPRRLTRFGANYLLKRAVRAAALARTVSANTLRRSFAAGALNAGSRLRVVQRRLGHADSRTTRRLSSPP